MSASETNPSLVLKKLSTLQDALGCLNDVIRLESNALTQSQQQELNSLRHRVKRQLEKLQRNEFHIAVVGLEKAGKSTFLNAWLGHDLLPNRQDRCTYAATELRSSSERDRHQLIIEYLDRDQFEADVKGYEAKAQTGGPEGKAALADLGEIRRYRSTLDGLLGRAREEHFYASLEEMRPYLEHYVANPQVARALRSVTICSAQLYHHSGIVFHDVPGYDSPISMHRELARQELARADAILFITNLVASSSLNQGQLDMLDVADAEDPDIQAHDKLFIFLNKIDASPSKADLKIRIDQARNELCRELQRCKPERVVPGSAGAYLMEKCSPLRPETRDMLERVPRLLEELSPPFGSGIEHLRKQVEHYLETERTALLARRCDALVRQGRELILQALETLGPIYPTSTAELAIAERVDRDSAVHTWLDEQWKRFEKELAVYWNREIMPSDSEDSPQRMNDDFKRVHAVYLSALTPLKNSLEPASLHATLQLIHAQIRDDYARPVETNLRLRRQLSEQHIAPELDSITEHMGTTFMAQIARIEDQVQKAFFGLESVRQHVLPEGAKNFQVRLAHGLSTLFLRHARPCLPLMIANPRGQAFRQRMMEVYRSEALSLQSFYINPEHPERANLPRFLLEGSPVVPAAIKGAVQVGASIAETYVGPAAPLVQPTANSVEEHLLQQLSSKPTIADNFEAVRDEIVEDCQVFIDFLEHAVYRAAGFEDYCKAELLRVRRHLIGEHSEEARRNIYREIRLAIERHDPRLPQEIRSLSDTSLRRRIVEALGRLRASYETFAVFSLEEYHEKPER